MIKIMPLDEPCHRFYRDTYVIQGTKFNEEKYQKNQKTKKSKNREGAKKRKARGRGKREKKASPFVNAGGKKNISQP